MWVIFLWQWKKDQELIGWYNEEIGEYALKHTENAKKEYPVRIKERLTFFSKNLGYTFDFYIKKISSMWTENTYGAVRVNTMDDSLDKLIQPLTFYQKAWIDRKSVV